MDHEEIAMTMEALRAERDQARAETDRQRQRADALETAARALVVGLEGDDSDVSTCESLDENDMRCPCLVTQRFLYDNLCDKHAAEHRADHPTLDLRPQETGYAAPLRALRALLEAKS